MRHEDAHSSASTVLEGSQQRMLTKARNPEGLSCEATGVRCGEQTGAPCEVRAEATSGLEPCSQREKGLIAIG